jgi:hypothetical protein
MSGQTKAGSLIEALTNIAVGCGAAFASQLVIFTHYGLPVSLSVNAKMTLFFTVISLVRSFLLRRFFNWLTVRRQSRQEAREWATPRLTPVQSNGMRGRECRPGILHAADADGNCLICPRSAIETLNNEFHKRQREGKL